MDFISGEGNTLFSKLHNEELSDLHSPPNIVPVINSRRMRYAGHVACMGERKRVCRVLLGNLRERNQLEEPRMDKRIILRRIYRK